ncbi:hypothetical protein [Burkholderia singularis]|uniref:hypothetical protein n=1 Tax=Burkholderia singularis TaxID=1503053 RepID=UPI000F76851A|nr:hypothetical protein [Burkholderia singularis]
MTAASAAAPGSGLATLLEFGANGKGATRSAYVRQAMRLREFRGSARMPVLSRLSQNSTHCRSNMAKPDHARLN